MVYTFLMSDYIQKMGLVVVFCGFLILFLLRVHYNTTSAASGAVLSPPEQGVYHAAFPDFGGTEDIVSTDRIKEFTNLAGKGIAWAYFSDNWTDGISFPHDAVRDIDAAGAVPFIRMMPRSGFFSGRVDPEYSLQNIIDGRYDQDLREWARDAKRTKMNLLLEFGTEVNSDWFSWNGKYNGAGETYKYGDPDISDGPERFVDAYRHIVKIFRSEEANNVTWFYHINAYSTPKRDWNTPKAYYPGDDYVDWVGVSVYGAQLQGDEVRSFESIMSDVYPMLSREFSNKPLAVLEWGATESPHFDKAAWIHDALSAVSKGQYPLIKAIAYWHENWEGSNYGISKLRIDSSRNSLEAYRGGVKDRFFLEEASFAK